MEDFFIRLLVWLAVGAVAYLAFMLILPVVTRRTTIQIDDIILGVTRTPFLIVLVATGLDHSSQALPIGSELTDTIDKIALFVIAMTIAWWLWRMLRQIVVAYGEQYAMETESPVDDILIPLTGRATPIFIGIALAFVIVWIAFGADGINTFLAVLGGLSFLLIFLFQEPLSNLFGGVYLLLDAPFRYGDLIILEDGKTYRVDAIGTRVTQLYDIAEHTVAYLPNNQLSAQRIVNITRPTVELRLGIDVGVSYESDVEHVVSVLEECADAHPNVLGVLQSKEEAIETRLNDLKDDETERGKLKLELDRLRAEAEMRESTEVLSRLLFVLSRDASIMKRHGLSGSERELLSAQIDSVERSLDALREPITRWLLFRAAGQAAYEHVELRAQQRDAVPDFDEIIDRIKATSMVGDRERVRSADLKPTEVAAIATLEDAEEEFLKSGIVKTLTPMLHIGAGTGDGVGNEDGTDEADPQRLAEAWIGEVPTTNAFSDIKRQHANWHRNVRYMEKKINECRTVLAQKGSFKEFFLDTTIEAMWDWSKNRFLLVVPSEQLPGAELVNFGASSIDFRLEFFIDDIQGEHFERRGRVEDEIRRDIARRFAAAGIDMPFPQLDLFVKNPGFAATRNGA